ncbi:MAG: shikimate dehydrogenase [Alphaproteobacteria bacterium]|nr:shikimate dehydrogenase [Alphaproteobacteria bacterium]
MSHGGKTRIAGVIGWPVSHSKSPRLHGYWLAHYGVDGAYVPLPVRPENVAAAVSGLAALGFAGANVTVPHKETVIASVDHVTATARRIGAVNTLVVMPDGKIRGDNTDAFGFIENLKHGTPQFSAAAGPAVVLGAGGAARAVCVALIEVGAPRIKLINRTRDRAEALKAALKGPIDVVDWPNRNAALADAALLVNSTSLGMTAQPALDLSLDRLPAEAVVNDLVYAPLETALLAAARRRGNPVVDGLGMLLYQAQAGFAAWFGVTPEVTPALRSHVLQGT